MIRVTVWNEWKGSGEQPDALKVYPKGIHTAIAEFLKRDEEIEIVKTATLLDPECGLDEQTLSQTDVLIWWAHWKHGEVPDEIAERVVRHVNCGMGIIFLHSAHLAKPFRMLMGTSCTLHWREDEATRERLWTISPAHEIARELPPHFELEHEEMYGERFDIPEPDETVFIGWYNSGEVFRSGVCYRRGLGKVFYFQPGHETFPVYYDKNIQRVLKNAVRWAKSDVRYGELACPCMPSIEKI